MEGWGVLCVTLALYEKSVTAGLFYYCTTHTMLHTYFATKDMSKFPLWRNLLFFKRMLRPVTSALAFVLIYLFFKYFMGHMNIFLSQNVCCFKVVLTLSRMYVNHSTKP